MKSILKKLALVFAVIFVVIQLIPVDRTNPIGHENLELIAPDEVIQIMKRSCFDCYSNHTEWPFYAYVAPVSWLITEHVNHGREHLNFCEWEGLPSDKKIEKTEEIWKEVSNEGMPIRSYRMVHPGSGLDERQKRLIREWSMSLGSN